MKTIWTSDNGKWSLFVEGEKVTLKHHLQVAELFPVVNGEVIPQFHIERKIPAYVQKAVAKHWPETVEPETGGTILTDDATARNALVEGIDRLLESANPNSKNCRTPSCNNPSPVLVQGYCPTCVNRGILQLEAFEGKLGAVIRDNRTDRYYVRTGGWWNPYERTEKYLPFSPYADSIREDFLVAKDRGEVLDA